MIEDTNDYFINTRDGEDLDLRFAVRVKYNEAWKAWQVGYTDEDGKHTFVLVKDAKSKEEAHIRGILEVKEHGFIRDQLWLE